MRAFTFTLATGNRYNLKKVLRGTQTTGVSNLAPAADPTMSAHWGTVIFELDPAAAGKTLVIGGADIPTDGTGGGKIGTVDEKVVILRDRCRIAIGNLWMAVPASTTIVNVVLE